MEPEHITHTAIPPVQAVTSDKTAPSEAEAPKAAEPTIVATNEAPAPVQAPEKPSEYAYTIDDPAFGEFKVLNSANGWWLDRRKVEKLIDAFKIDATDEQARFYAGVTRGQLDYFREIHPEFSEIKRVCGENLGLLAKTHIAKEIKDNSSGRPSWYLERREKENYSLRTEHTGAGGKDLIPLTDEQEEKIAQLAGIKKPTNDNPGPSTIPPDSNV